MVRTCFPYYHPPTTLMSDNGWCGSLEASGVRIKTWVSVHENIGCSTG